MGNRDRVQVHDADIGVVGVLQVNPVTDGPKPITEMQRSRRLNTGEDPWPRPSIRPLGQLSGLLVSSEDELADGVVAAFLSTASSLLVGVTSCSEGAIRFRPTFWRCFRLCLGLAWTSERIWL
jgi:hypothetical protein